MSGLARASSMWASQHGFFGGDDEWVSTNKVCDHCGGRLPIQRHQGNPRRWCSETCRVAAWKAARKS